MRKRYLLPVERKRPAIDGGCKQHTNRAHVFSHAHPVSVLVVTVYSHTLTPCARIAEESRSSLFVSGTKTVTPRRAMSYLTPRWTTPSTCTPSLFSTTFLVLVTVFFCRASTSQRVSLLRSTTASEWRFGGAPSTGYEPKPPDELDHKHFTADKQFAEHEDLRVKPCSSTDRA